MMSGGMITAALLGLLLLVDGTPASAIGPSLSCANGAARPAQVICASPAPSWLNLNFMQAHFALRQQTGSGGQSAPVRQAINLTRSVERTCCLPAAGPARATAPELASCIEREYERKRTGWITRSSVAAKEEATRPIEQHMALQRDQQTLGFVPSSVRIDGVYRPEAHAAIIARQKANGILTTGLLDKGDAATLTDLAAGKARGSGTGVIQGSVTMKSSPPIRGPVPTPSAPPASNTPVAAVLGSWAGAGTRNTPPFDAPGPWELRWCSSDTDAIIVVETTSGGAVDGSGGAPQGESYEPHGGSFYLSVEIDGPWHISAVVFSPGMVKAYPCTGGPPAPAASKLGWKPRSEALASAPSPVLAPSTNARLRQPQPVVSDAAASTSAPPAAQHALASSPSGEATQWIEIMQADQRHDYATELHLLRPLAHAGVAWAQNDLGLMYQEGAGVAQNAAGGATAGDYAEAVKWYRLAAAQGLAAAQSNLSIMYYKGHGVPQNYAKAAKWDRLAATQEKPAAASAPVSFLPKPVLAMTSGGTPIGFCPTVAVTNKVDNLMLRSLAAMANSEEYTDSDPRKSFAFLAQFNELQKEFKAAYAQYCSHIAGDTAILIVGATISDDGTNSVLFDMENGQRGVIAAEFVAWQ